MSAQALEGEQRGMPPRDYNRSDFIGTVQRMPQLFKTEEGLEVADFRIDNRDVRVGARGYVNHTNEIDVRAFGPDAVRVCQQLRKNARVLIQGRLESFKELRQRRPYSGVRVAMEDFQVLAYPASQPGGRKPSPMRPARASGRGRPAMRDARPRAGVRPRPSAQHAAQGEQQPQD